MSAYTIDTPIIGAVKRLLPFKALQIFLKSANECAAAGQEHNDAMVSAWAAVKEAGYERSKGGRWVRKDDPGAGDVHVDAPMGGKRPKKMPKAPAPMDETETMPCGCDANKAAATILRGAADLLEVSKTLPPGASAKDYIDDFVNSDAPQFQGKSKEERIQMALAAWEGGKAFNPDEARDEHGRWTAAGLSSDWASHFSQGKSVTDIGQFSPGDKKALGKLVRQGHLGKEEDWQYGGPRHTRYYPVPLDQVKPVQKDAADGDPTPDELAPTDAAATPQTLYVNRPLINSADIADWAKGQGFSSMLQPDDLHATVAFSRQPFDTSGLEPDNELVVVPASADRSVTKFGDASVLRFTSPDLRDRWQQFQDAGASWDHPDYQPHLTITYNGDGIDHDAIQAYDGPLIFGPEEFAPVNEDWSDNIQENTVKSMDIVKVDDDQRTVYGWASVISENGKPYVDSQGDMIDAATLTKAVTDFMIDVRRALAMHERTPDGKIDPAMQKGLVVHSFPITADIAKSLGLSSDKEGWIVGLKISDEPTWQLVKTGKLRAFSIGGAGQRVPA